MDGAGLVVISVHYKRAWLVGHDAADVDQIFFDLEVQFQPRQFPVMVEKFLLEQSGLDPLLQSHLK